MSRWSPLLSGSLAERALESSAAIGQALIALGGPSDYAPRYVDGGDPSLGTGTAGLAICLDYLADAGVVGDVSEKSREWLDLSTEAMATVSLEPSLFGGYLGIGWAATRLGSDAERGDADDSVSNLDDELSSLLESAPWKLDYDLVSGLVGFGVYALERLPRPVARKCLSRLVARLSEIAEVSDRGVTWHTAPALLTAHQKETFPAGHYNLGLAHGVPGVIALLAQIVAADEQAAEARSLLTGSVRWLLDQKREGASRFSYWTGAGVPYKEGRSAWCYGDPGVAAALLVAARCVNEPSWEREAVELALHAAVRPIDDTGVIDPSVCHGAAGLAHIFNRIHQACGDERIGRAATSWFERTLDMRAPGTGIAGFTTALKNLDGAITFETDPTLLSGAAGIAMTLAAAATSTEPEWDRLLLLSSAYEPAR